MTVGSKSPHERKSNRAINTKLNYRKHMKKKDEKFNVHHISNACVDEPIKTW